ncbi:flagellar biosynthesis anti-sigma factor FlgM [Novosphingobium sp.]|uniref:flagellar biosynthesis anti-sigma factor FlgM n=1 Tax=Novosphingobium sp. TaxID=1874826 RepID=UPI002736EE9A|nr:flagellar biosynthesis anti-sigma factor FlgM [Novosphingobium sp.]MDP3908410.1 flagellar biosynthesis anti-sigma factor FlgM [Novosphingobium sp.]
MPFIEYGPKGLQPARAVGAVDVRAARPDTRPSARGTVPASAAPAVERSAALDAGAAPVDADRVSEIRKAIDKGNYPVIPMRAADAMIAAGLLLRSGK